jgi:NADH dehydrogenase
MKTSTYAVTGAFGYSGRYITRRLLSQGAQVITLTGHLNRPDPFDGRVPAYPFHFDDPHALAAVLKGVDALFNTYWVRFDHGEASYRKAVDNTRTLIRAARQAGVRRLVHLSITNAEPGSSLPYFQGKGVLEREIQGSGLSFAILRPTVIFGREDVLINNIAWLLRRFPWFAIPGDGRYRLQPVHVDDLAAAAVAAAAGEANFVQDVAGPRSYSFAELVRLLAQAIGARPRLVHLPPGPAWFLARLVGWGLGDVLLTRDEVRGLMAGLLVSENPPVGETSLEAWLAVEAAGLGRAYASELRRHYRPASTG